MTHRFLPAFALGLALAAGCAGAALAAPEVGAPAPAISVVDTAGKVRTLDEFKGKTVVLEWTNHQCPFVAKHYDTGNMQGLQKQATADGVVWLSVISSEPGSQGHLQGAEADKLNAGRKAFPTAVLLDETGVAGKAYGATNTPHMYVIAPDGKLAYKGAIDDKPTTRKSDVEGARNYVVAALGAVAQNRPADPAATRAYGCSIKYAY